MEVFKWSRILDSSKMKTVEPRFSRWGSIEWKGVSFLYDTVDWLTKELIKGTKTHKFKAIWIDPATGQHFTQSSSNVLDYYNENGDLIKRLRYGNDDNVISTKLFYYDNLNNLIFHETDGYYDGAMLNAHLFYQHNELVGSVFNYGSNRGSSIYNIQLKRPYVEDIEEAYLEVLDEWMGNIERKELLLMSYNDDYLLTEQTTIYDYQSSSEFQTKYCYEYDEEKRLIKKSFQNKNGKFFPGGICTYDNNGGEKIIDYYDEKKASEKYYKDGLIIRELKYDINDGDEVDEEIVYNYENNNLKQKTEKRNNKTTITDFVYEYDENERVKKKSTYIDESLEMVEEFLYDEKGREIDFKRYSHDKDIFGLTLHNLSIIEDY